MWLVLCAVASADPIDDESRWPAIARACLTAYPERIDLPVATEVRTRCLALGVETASCAGHQLVSPSAAACVGHTLEQFDNGGDDFVPLKVVGPHASNFEHPLVYAVEAPRPLADIRPHGWLIDASTGVVLHPLQRPQLNMMMSYPPSLPYE